MIKQFRFTLATSKLCSEVSSIEEFEFEDDVTQEEIDNVITEAYGEWINNHNYGGYSVVE